MSAQPQMTGARPAASPRMLHEFIAAHRTELIDRCRFKSARSDEFPASAPTAEYGIPHFLDQLAETLRTEQQADVRGVRAHGKVLPQSQIGRAAALHGVELLRRGFTVDEVVHEYGNVCQAVTELAIEETTPISTDEFRTLNRCLDNAIADAVSSYALAGKELETDRAQDLDARLDFLAEEHRRLVVVATSAFSAIKAGNVGATGATGSLLSHALSELGNLIERAMPEIRSAAEAASE